MNKKKIALHIIMPNQISGPNNASQRIANSWLKEEYDFGFITQNFLAGSKINFKLIKDLKKQIKIEKPHLIHFSGLQSSGFHAVVAARIAGYKNIIITIRGFSGDDLKLNKFKNFIFTNIIEPFTLHLCRGFITVCEESYKKRMVITNKNKHIGILHNAAPVIDFNIINSREKIRNELQANNDDFLIAISGRMVYDKGISYIIDAMENINNTHIKFVFIGDGPYKEIIEVKYGKEISQKKIILLGKRNDVMHILSGCDLFCFATLHENLSNALLEAMTIGLPIIATNVGGNKEVVEDNVNGFFIPPYDSKSIVEKINLIYNDKDIQKRFSNASKEIIKNKFSQEVLYSKLHEIYEKFLEK